MKYNENANNYGETMRHGRQFMVGTSKIQRGREKEKKDESEAS